MSKKKAYSIFSSFITVFYFIIMMYLFFGIMHMEQKTNFYAVLIFEIIAFLILEFIILNGILSEKIKIAYFIPTVMVTVVYKGLVDIFCILYVSYMEKENFILLNMIVLFSYCLISFPMRIMGRK